MPRFNIDVRVIGYSQITVEAESVEEAEDKVCEKIMEYKVADLRWKETQYTNLDEEGV